MTEFPVPWPVMSVMVRHSLQSRRAGLATAVGSAAAFGTSGTLAASLLRSGWSPAAAVTIRLAIASLALSVPALSMLRGRAADLRSRAGMLGAYGLVAVAAAQLCYFQAIRYLSVPVALLVEYSGTILVVGWMWARHRQVPSRATTSGAVLAVAGLILVLDLTGHQHVSPLGLLWGLGAATGLASYFVMSADSDSPLPPLVTAWGGMAIGAVGMAAAAAVGVVPWQVSNSPSTLAGHHVSPLVVAAVLGLVAGALAYATGITAARTLGARLSSFIGLAEVLFAAIWSWVLLGQRLGPTQIIGAALVVAGVSLVRAGESAEAPSDDIDPEAAEPAAAVLAG